MKHPFPMLNMDISKLFCQMEYYAFIVVLYKLGCNECLDAFMILIKVVSLKQSKLTYMQCFMFPANSGTFMMKNFL